MLSRQQKRMFPSQQQDTLEWPYPTPMVAAGPGQYRRALRAARAQHEVMGDGSCYIITRRGFAVARVWAIDSPPPPCDPEIFKTGIGLCVIDARSHAAEAWVQAVAAKSGQRVDWHYSGGRASVLVLGDHARAVAAVRELAPTLDGTLLSISTDGRALYRAGEPLPYGVLGVDTSG